MAFGVYVHIPFCSRRCGYCAFATWTDRHHLIGDYIAACRREMANAGSASAGLIPGGTASFGPATSIFVGGGTPSLVPPSLLAGLLAEIPKEPGVEITVECNPETVTPALVETLLGAGVTRLSFGVQSMVPHVLAGLGRSHDPGAVVRAARLAVRCGVASWNADLIFGGAGEHDRDWRRSLDEVLALEPPHVSAYALTVEPGTPLAADTARHPDDDVLADRYLEADSVLAAAGLENYEISNWARAGHECRHNLLYWEQGDYRGIGCAAHSHERGRRWWNMRTPERYMACVASGRSPVAGCEVLDEVTRERERLELAVRTRRGVPALAVGDLDLLVDAGLVVPMGDRVVLTARGRLVANEVAVRLRVADGVAAG